MRQIETKSTEEKVSWPKKNMRRVWRSLHSEYSTVTVECFSADSDFASQTQRSDSEKRMRVLAPSVVGTGHRYRNKCAETSTGPGVRGTVQYSSMSFLFRNEASVL